MEAKISIIVPIFNVEEYLSKCIDSILCQTFTNLEIILVNDGSTDKSGKICDQYAKKDKRIIVLHKENGGLSSARNAGLDIATGEFIGFVDSDDYIDANMYEILYNSIIENNCEISIARLQRSDNVVIEDNRVQLMNKFEALERTILSNDLEVCIPPRLYKRSIFNNLRFEIGKVYEDFIIVTDIFLKAENVVYNGNAIYNYTIRIGSITHPERIKVNEDIIYAASKTLMVIKKEGKLKPNMVWGCLRREKDMLNYCSKNLLDNKNMDFINKSRKLFKSYYPYLLRSNLLSCKEKISITFFCYCFPMYKFVVNRNLTFYRKETIE